MRKSRSDCQCVSDRALLLLDRQWYCSSSPQFPIGAIQIGNLGSQMYYASSSNPWILSECDLTDSLGNPLADPNVGCKGVTKLTPVTRQCCGFCILSQAHLMRMWNCTGLSDPVTDPLAIQALALYCTQTLHCSESRPCLGSPVQMGDPSQLFDPSQYSIGCNQLNPGCDAAGHCSYRWACDNTIEALRQRLGFYATSTAAGRAAPGLAGAALALLAAWRLARAGIGWQPLAGPGP